MKDMVREGRVSAEGLRPTHSLLVCLSFPWRSSDSVPMVTKELRTARKPGFYVLFSCCQESPAPPLASW